MADLSCSVVIVSKDRPRLLQRCMLAVGQLDYPCFEIVVVACAQGATALSKWASRVRTTIVPFDEANISRARNIGITHTQGDIIAFVDDDAVPESTWLSHLTQAFAQENVAQAGGTTLGRNGISVQHAAARVTSDGVSRTVPVRQGGQHMLIQPDGDAFPRLHGTNMAIRRDVLVRLGGFDERFAFYLDETDLTRRVAKDEGGTVHVPLAVVHHASGPSVFRRPDRTPRSLYEIAASAAVFHRKHASDKHRACARSVFFDTRRAWLLRHMQNGTLTPDDAWHLIAEMRRGYAHGVLREPIQTQIGQNLQQGMPFIATASARDVYLVARPGRRKTTLSQARDLVEQGMRVTVFDYDATPRYHKVTFTQDGYWHHNGGIFGREDRHAAFLQCSTRNKRVIMSLERIKGIRSRPQLTCAQSRDFDQEP